MICIPGNARVIEQNNLREDKHVETISQGRRWKLVVCEKLTDLIHSEDLLFASIIPTQ